MLVHAMLSFPLQNTASACLWWTLAALGWGVLHPREGVAAARRPLPVLICAAAGAYLIWLSPWCTVYSRSVRAGEGYTVYGQRARASGRSADAETYLVRAEEALLRAIDLRRDSPKPHFLLSTALALAGRYEEAEESAELHLRLDPHSREGWHNLGRMFEEQGKLEEAAAGYATAAEINPYDPAERTALGIALGKLGRHEDAAEELRAAVELSEGEADAWANLGVALHGAGRDAEAVETWRKAADLYRRAGQRPEETLQWRRILAVDPEDTQARGRLGG
jgi:tetratricopeptide (TPR) repeat protein